MSVKRQAEMTIYFNTWSSKKLKYLFTQKNTHLKFELAYNICNFFIRSVVCPTGTMQLNKQPKSCFLPVQSS